jgi:hypothetical protein
MPAFTNLLYFSLQLVGLPKYSIVCPDRLKEMRIDLIITLQIVVMCRYESYWPQRAINTLLACSYRRHELTVNACASKL